MFVSGWEDDNIQNFNEEKEELPEDADTSAQVLAAARNNDIEKMKEFLKEDSTLVNVFDSDGYTPLHRACYSNNLEMVEFLLQNGADVAARTVDGWQPLHSACHWGHARCATLLVQNLADINARTNGNQTPLHLAAANRNSEQTLQLLLWQHSIDTTIMNDSGDSAYDIAKRSSIFSHLFEIANDDINCV